MKLTQVEKNWLLGAYRGINTSIPYNSVYGKPPSKNGKAYVRLRDLGLIDSYDCMFGNLYCHITKEGERYIENSFSKK